MTDAEGNITVLANEHQQQAYVNGYLNGNVIDLSQHALQPQLQQQGDIGLANFTFLLSSWLMFTITILLMISYRATSTKRASEITTLVMLSTHWSWICVAVDMCCFNIFSSSQYFIRLSPFRINPPVC